eukprot:CAMPEP_0176004862 /NCGR_PEP_ID=MMETSP0120_2-20121206/1912_1 /TAXON_ID=160619 /ORGANISM="Kryptoperidinium foliaceum, Strain CCMP 1326" /LENGTH=235 /DNA_ID=CAMNT_0017337557 /DNA_START=91 /DNA_END=795 /DNA_ORIENTATION=-
MMYMNLATMKDTIKSVRDSIMNQIANFNKTWNQFRAKTGAIVGEIVKGKNIETASRVNVVVSRLGLSLQGSPDIDETAPYEEQQEMKMTKKMAYFTRHTEIAESSKEIRSVTDTPRYSKDVASTLPLALDIDQLLLRKSIPQIMATIQCVNHTSSSLSDPRYDSYLTLFKPDGWEEENDADKEKVDTMVNDWKKKVNKWMKDSLGASFTDRTSSKNIVREIEDLLRSECTQDVHR